MLSLCRLLKQDNLYHPPTKIFYLGEERTYRVAPALLYSDLVQWNLVSVHEPCISYCIGVLCGPTERNQSPACFLPLMPWWPALQQQNELVRVTSHYMEHILHPRFQCSSTSSDFVMPSHSYLPLYVSGMQVFYFFGYYFPCSSMYNSTLCDRITGDLFFFIFFIFLNSLVTFVF